MSVRYQTGPHSMTEVTHHSYASNVGNSMCGACFGGVLVFVATLVLWFNEGNAVATATELDSLRGMVVHIDENADPSIHAGRPVHVAASVNGGVITDSAGPYTLTVDAVKLARSTEMFQWVEHARSHTEKHVGGGSTTTTSYDYTQQWSSSSGGQGFKMPGHENPRKMPEASLSAESIKLGGLRLGAEVVDKLPTYDLRLTKEMVTGDVKWGPNYLYLGRDEYQPQIGDHKVSYRSLPNGSPVSVVGVLQRDGTMTGAAHSVLPLVEGGHSGVDEMIDNALASNTFMLWMLRVVGFFLMLVGVSMCIEPINAVADVIPLFGSIIRMFTGAASWLVAIVLTVLVCSVAWLFARPLLSLLLIGGILAALYAGRTSSPRRSRSD